MGYVKVAGEKDRASQWGRTRGQATGKSPSRPESSLWMAAMSSVSEAKISFIHPLSPSFFPFLKHRNLFPVQGSRQWFSKCNPGTSSILRAGGLLDKNIWGLPQTHHRRHSAWTTGIL